jgi:drug/metabolite transporter (DMT)-like permease
MVPVVAMLVAWLWLGERPTPLQVAGAAVILGGISVARLGTSHQLPPRVSDSPGEAGVTAV